jgi:hypothetical protein
VIALHLWDVGRELGSQLERKAYRAPQKHRSHLITNRDPKAREGDRAREVLIPFLMTATGPR